MSFQMIHMEIAYRLLEYLPQVEYPAEFILGSVAPDAVHMARQFDVERKIRSHLFEDCGPWGDTRDSERWRHNIRTFYERGVCSEREPARRDLALGVCAHCLTDHWNDIRIWRKAQRAYLPKMAFDAFREVYYREYRNIDWWLYQNSEHTEAIRRLLAEASPIAMQGLADGEELKRLKEHLLYEQYDVKEVDITQNLYFTVDRITDFMEFVVEDIRERLVQWDNVSK